MKHKYNSATTNVAIASSVHRELVNHLHNSKFKIGKWVEEAVQEKMENDKRNARLLERVMSEV